MSSLLNRLKQSSKLSGTDILSDSDLFGGNDVVQTNVPMINVALSGSIDGGLTSGLTVLAGPSKHFKTSFALLMAASYLKAKKDAVLIFYDSEFGSPQSYFESFGIDTKRVLHTPIMNIEELKFDIVHQLEQLDKKDNVIIVIDSVGNVASKKELDDALNEKSVADMTRAKALKGLFRMITPYLQTKSIPLIAINHTYKEQGLFPKDIVSGGTGIYYSADNIWIIGRQQDKKGTEIKGYHFIINVEKSRFVREKSKIPISVGWDRGIMKWSGLLDVALEGGWVKKPKQGWYAAYASPDDEEPVGKSVREKDTHTAEFWKPFLTNKEFTDHIKGRYSTGNMEMLNDEED